MRQQLIFWGLFSICSWTCIYEGKNVVNVYTHRHYKADEEIFKAFTRQTGIRVNVIKSAADQLISRLETEGQYSPADLLITVDAGRLWRAKQKGLLQPVSSDILLKNIPTHLRDRENYWFAFSFRCRVIIYNKEKVDPSALSTYEGLAEEKWRGRFLPRSSSSEYNQSLLASIIAHRGAEEAEKWCKAMVGNFARPPKGNDTENILEVASGKGDITLANSYYLAKMITSEVAAEREGASKVGVFFPNQHDRGAHINVSGMALVKYAPHKENAVKLLEFISEQYAQQRLTNDNFEYPVHPLVSMCETLQRFGSFKADTLDLSLLGKYHEEAVKIFDRSGWK